MHILQTYILVHKHIGGSEGRYLAPMDPKYPHILNFTDDPEKAIQFEGAAAAIAARPYKKGNFKAFRKAIATYKPAAIPLTW